MIANGCVIFLLLTQRQRKVADLLVLHLSLSEFLGVTWNVILRPLQWFSSVEYVPIVRVIGGQFFGALFYQSIICISFDRLLAAKLVLRYRVLITKRRLQIVLLLIWVLSIMCAVICAIEFDMNTIIWMFWSSITIASILISYSYIAMVLYKQKQFQRNSSCTHVQRFNYKIPLCITLSYILTMFIPDIVVVIDETLFTVWTLVIWYTNFLIDPLVYVFFRVFYKRRSERQLSVSSRNSNITAITTTV